MFKVGDKVIGLSTATYGITKEGVVLLVTYVEGSSFCGKILSVVDQRDAREIGNEFPGLRMECFALFIPKPKRNLPVWF